MKKILMIATGGTIASVGSEHGLTPAMTGEELAANVPGIQDKCELNVLQLMNIDSTNMRPKGWLKIRSSLMERRRGSFQFPLIFPRKMQLQQGERQLQIRLQELL